MPLLIAIALMALPFVELWLMILVGQQIGAAWTIATLFALSTAGVLVLRGAGTRAYREADQAIRTGTPPRGGLLDTLMVMVGGILLLIPGFVTGLLGALLALPFTRPALRWVFTAWAERRIRRMSGPGGAEFVAPGARIPRQDTGGGAPGSGRVIQGHIVDSDPEEPGGSDGARS